MPQTIDYNEQFERALDMMECTLDTLFITGRAGTGKSTLLDQFREQTEKNIVVLAPTGVAAINVKGQTIHSFFGFKPDITVSKAEKLAQSASDDIYKHLDTIVIDEISMVRADLLDCIDAFMRVRGKTRGAPFGGVQLIMIGDLYQLPPVITRFEQDMFSLMYKTPYFFSAKCWQPDSSLFGAMQQPQITCIELSKIYRQKDPRFIMMLNAIRDGQIGYELLKLLNERVNTSFTPQSNDGYITLTTTNNNASQINMHALDRLEGKEYTLHATIKGNLEERDLPTDTVLRLKNGAQVMMLNNDSGGQWVNGTVGVIENIEKDQSAYAEEDDVSEITVRLEDGSVISVGRHKWDLFQFSYDAASDKVSSQVVASFTQYPLKLAWAITIHKSQGKTFDHVIVDMERGAFSAGQTYVALSRCTSLNGLVLRKPIRQKDCWIDKEVVAFMESLA